MHFTSSKNRPLLAINSPSAYCNLLLDRVERYHIILCCRLQRPATVAASIQVVLHRASKTCLHYAARTGQNEMPIIANISGQIISTQTNAHVLRYNALQVINSVKYTRGRKILSICVVRASNKPTPAVDITMPIVAPKEGIGSAPPSTNMHHAPKVQTIPGSMGKGQGAETPINHLQHQSQAQQRASRIRVLCLVLTARITYPRRAPQQFSLRRHVQAGSQS